MFCTNCGKNLNSNAAFCPFCGSKIDVASRQEEKNIPEEPAVINPNFAKPVFTEEINRENKPVVAAMSSSETFNNPFGSTSQSGCNSIGGSGTGIKPEISQAYQQNSNPFGSNVSQQQASHQSQANPFGSQQVQPQFSQAPFKPQSQQQFYQQSQPDFNQTPNRQMPNNVTNDRPAKNDKKEKAQSSTGKFVVMFLAQVVFVGIVCGMGFTGMLNDKMGNINLGMTIVLLGIIMGAEALLYVLLFSGNKKKELAPPPAEYRKPQVTNEVPRYMNQAPQMIEDEPTEVQSVSGFDDDDGATVVMDINVPKPRYPKLEYVENGEKKEIIINKEEFIIGRLHGRVDFITTNRKIGRIHAAIITKGNSYYIKDFNSQNKTYINRGGAISPEEEHLLHDNDVISFADSEFVFRLPE